jgi:cobalt-zinc-cadmium efflux system protein
VLAIALAGIPVNVAATWILSRADRRSVNVEGAFQHVLTDLYAFVATAIAATVILTTGFDRADAIAALVVAALMLRSAYGLLRASGRIFLEAAPEGLNPDEIGRTLAGARAVVSVHDLHVWEVTSGFPALSAHVVVGTDEDCHEARARLELVLREQFGIDHSTLQVEHAPRKLLEIEPQETPPFIR